MHAFFLQSCFKYYMSDDISKDDEGMDEQCRLVHNVYFYLFIILYDSNIFSRQYQYLCNFTFTTAKTYPKECTAKLTKKVKLNENSVVLL